MNTMSPDEIAGARVGPPSRRAVETGTIAAVRAALQSLDLAFASENGPESLNEHVEEIRRSAGRMVRGG